MIRRFLLPVFAFFPVVGFAATLRDPAVGTLAVGKIFLAR